MKKIFFIVAVLIAIVAGISIYLSSPSFLLTLDGRIRDVYFKIRGPVKTTGNVVIVDIDEKSLGELGQWPWRRDILAQILMNLTKAQAGIIGLDMFFPEKDGKSPCNVLNQKHLLNTDEILAQAFEKSPTITGYLFNFDKNITKGALPKIPAIFVQRHLSKEYLLKAKGYISNLPILQSHAYSGGFVNMIPDVDGVVRYVPLLIKYKGMIYPSLAFEMFRIAYNARKVIIDYSPAGVDSIELKGYKIPTDRFGRIFINYRGDKGSFKYISAADVYYDRFDKNLVKNKFVLIGTSAVGLFDLRVTPFNNVYPGVEVHANIIDNLLKGDFIFKPDFAEILDILMIVVISIIIGLIIYFLDPLSSFAIIALLFFAFLGGTYYLLFHYGYILELVIPLLIFMFLSLVLYTANYLFETKKSKRLKKAFEKKVSPQVLEELIKNAQNDAFEPKNKEVSVFFSDIWNFTSIAEKLGDPKNVIEMLNIYLTPVAELITKHKGTIDKFIGDAVMAYWNAPISIENHADEAVSCAVEQVEKLKETNDILKKKFGLKISIGIGINTGVVTIGEMGSAGRSDYTIIGDNVNLASRLEGLTKYYKTHIIISEYTKNLLKKDYIIRELDLVKVKGKAKPIKIYEVLGYGNRDFSEYNEALEKYRKGEFKEALKIFKKLYDEEGAYIYQIYIQRCEDMIQNPPKDFDGVFIFNKK